MVLYIIACVYKRTRAINLKMGQQPSTALKQGELEQYSNQEPFLPEGNICYEENGENRGMMSHKALLALPTSIAVRSHIERQFDTGDSPFSTNGATLSPSLGSEFLCHLSQSLIVLYAKAMQEWKSEMDYLKEDISKLKDKFKKERSKSRLVKSGIMNNVDILMDGISSISVKKDRKSYDSNQVANGLIPLLPYLGCSLGLRNMRGIFAACLASLVSLTSPQILDREGHVQIHERIESSLKGVIPSRRVLKEHMLGLTKQWRNSFRDRWKSSSHPLIIYMDGTEVKKGRRDKQEMVIVECEGERVYIPYALEREKGTDLLACLENALTEEVLYEKKDIVLCTDGGSANTGKEIGVAKLINDERLDNNQLDILHIVCLSHALHNGTKDLYEWIKEDIGKHFDNEVYAWVEEKEFKIMEAAWKKDKRPLKSIKTKKKKKDGEEETWHFVQGGHILQALDYLLFAAPGVIGCGKSWSALTDRMDVYRQDKHFGEVPSAGTIPNNLDTERLLHLGELDDIMWQKTSDEHKLIFKDRFYPTEPPSDPSTPDDDAAGLSGVVSDVRSEERNDDAGLSDVVSDGRREERNRVQGGAMIPRPPLPNPSRFLYALDAASHLSLFGNAYIYGFDSNGYQEMFPNVGPEQEPEWRTHLRNDDARVILAVLGLSLLPVLKTHLLSVQRKEWAGAAACHLVRFIGEDMENVLLCWQATAATEASYRKKNARPKRPVFDYLGLKPSHEMLDYLQGEAFTGLGKKLNDYILEHQGGSQKMWLRSPYTLLGLVDKQFKSDAQFDKRYAEELRKDHTLIEKLGEKNPIHLNIKRTENVDTWSSIESIYLKVQNMKHLVASSALAEGGFSKLERLLQGRPSMEQDTTTSYMFLSTSPIAKALKESQKSYHRADPREQKRWMHTSGLSDDSFVFLQEKVQKKGQKTARSDTEEDERVQVTKRKRVEFPSDYHKVCHKLDILCNNAKTTQEKEKWKSLYDRYAANPFDTSIDELNGIN